MFEIYFLGVSKIVQKHLFEAQIQYLNVSKIVDQKNGYFSIEFYF